MVQLVEALRYKPEGYGFDSRWCHWGFFVDLILPVSLWSSDSDINEYKGVFREEMVQVADELG